jgi:ankyrin repeat protein
MSSSYLTVSGFVLVSLLSLPAFGSSHQEARRELERRNIAFDNNTFVEYAALGNRAVVELFLAAGLNVNARDKDGRSAIRLAARDGRADVVRTLLLHRAAVDQASQGAYEEGKTALMFAAQRGPAKVVETLLDAGAKIDATTHAGKTALMYAAEPGRTAAVQILLARGAAIDLDTMHGWTALLFAADGGHADVVQALLKKGRKWMREEGA